jgi:hypothetical protein
MLLNYTLIFVSLVLFAGMAVDAGLLERDYLLLQSATSAVAAAASVSLQRSAGYPPTSGPSATNITTATLAGKAAATANGFTDGVNGVAVTVTVTAVASSYSSTVAATITESVAPTFLGILGLGKINMKAQASTTTSVPVNLTSYYNVFGIYTDGHAIPSNGGFDNAGYAFSANLLGQARAASGLGAMLSWRGQIFTFAAPNVVNGVTQTTISLPKARSYSQLLILASADWSYSPFATGAFVVTYTDGSTASTSMNMSDWCVPEYLAGETIVSTQAYREDDASGTLIQDPRVNNIYGYSINVDNTKNLSTLKLPTQRNVVVFAINVAP